MDRLSRLPWRLRKQRRPRTRAEAAEQEILVLMMAGFLLLRLVSVMGIPGRRFFDTGDYLHLDFTGRGVRLFTVPLLYKLLPTDHVRVFGQAIFGALAWCVLAFVVARTCHGRRVGLVGAGVVLLLGLTEMVVNWDTAILSESFSVSFTVLLAAAWIWYIARPSAGAAVWAGATSVLWTFCRQQNVALVGLITVAVVISLLAPARRLQRAALAGCLALTTIVGYVETTRNHYVQRFNLTWLVAARVVDVPERHVWFSEHGMPDIPPATQALAVHPRFDALLADQTFQRWADGPGQSQYIRFLLTHPSYLVLSPLPTLFTVHPAIDLTPEEKNTLASPGDPYGLARPLLPRALDDLLFGEGQTGSVVFFGVVIVISALAAVRRFRWDRNLTVPAVGLLLSGPSLLVVYHGSPTELNRHAVVFALTLHLALLLAAVYVVDVVAAGRRAAQDGVAVPGGASSIHV